MLSIGQLQRINLKKEINQMTSEEKKIAEKILQKWDIIVVSSHDIMLQLLLPIVVSSTIAFFFKIAFLSITSPFLFIIWFIFLVVAYYASFKFNLFDSKPMIENMPKEKAELEEILNQPMEKDVFERMKASFNKKV